MALVPRGKSTAGQDMTASKENGTMRAKAAGHGEYNVLPWAKKQLLKFFANDVLDDAGVLRTTRLERVEGECMFVVRRKQCRAVCSLSVRVGWIVGAPRPAGTEEDEDDVASAQARGVITLDELSPEALTEGLDLNVLFITSAVKGVSPGSPANPPVA